MGTVLLQKNTLYLINTTDALPLGHRKKNARPQKINLMCVCRTMSNF